ncbi:stage V sporulation protein AE [Bacillus taeanensis]|uniref:Stage V sporulation protein AE n=1 Tax=Bacillus taeanensis TaxID=273032 RepID=A0A366Y1T5_9BACI|nr:stage V sporulation protein AE [Bacillus taeanensis]RBW70364.1 stage V sporulation protein AE [Bacillus taeanensis]
MDKKKRVILFTDGDHYALKAVEHVAKEIGGRCITMSAGNPTLLSGSEIVKLIHKASDDPIFVLFDDAGFKGEGRGEAAMRYVATHPSLEVLGAVAVASRTSASEWTKVDVSIDRFGNLTEHGVDKSGLADLEVGRIDGDTVSVLDELALPIVIGIGDLGKMAGKDSVEEGAPITKKAVEVLLERSGKYGTTS